MNVKLSPEAFEYVSCHVLINTDDDFHSKGKLIDRVIELEKKDPGLKWFWGELRLSNKGQYPSINNNGTIELERDVYEKLRVKHMGYLI